MRVFLTGATGFIGSHIIPELLAAGHQVLGVTRSDDGAAKLAKAGVEIWRGTLEDEAGLADGAAQCDAVIHCAFDHDFSNFVANCEKDRRVIAAMGAALAGSGKPMLITSGVGLGSPGPGRLATEDVFDAVHPNPRVASELEGQKVQATGVDVRVIRLPQVHNTERQGLISPLVQIARAKGVSAYVGEGRNRFSAAPVTDVARLYVLALDKGEPNARYNAVAEEGVATRDIAEVLGAGLKLPVVSLTPDEAAGHFGWMGMFVGMDLPASSAWTREQLGWTPTGPSLISDLQRMDYSAA